MNDQEVENELYEWAVEQAIRLCDGEMTKEQQTKLNKMNFDWSHWINEMKENSKVEVK